MRLKSFELGPHKYKITYSKNVVDPSSGELVLGLTEPLQNRIQVCTHWNGEKLSEEAIEHTTWHEIVHAILIIMSESELNSNEKFVDSFGSYLSQIGKTKKAR